MSDKQQQSFKDGDELMFHIASLGAHVVPLPEQVMIETGAAVTMELNMMSGIYRGEDDQYWLVDVTSVDPPLLKTRLLKAGVDLIGVKSTIEAVKRRIEPAS
jgi:hypothetical protein